MFFGLFYVLQAYFPQLVKVWFYKTAASDCLERVSEL